MKASEILQWVCRESINGEDLCIVDVPEDATEEWWYNMFGGCPPYVIPSGKYLYYYASTISSYGIGVDPDTEIELCNTGTMYDYDYICLFKIED